MTTDYPGAGSPAPFDPVADHVPTIDVDIDAPPRASNPIVRLFIDYNPFYFLSACCMLLGIFVLNDSLDWSPLPQDNLLILIATLGVYEVALIALGLLLLRKGLIRDGVFLLFLEAFFLADAGFLNMEVFTTDVHVGMIVNATLFALAAVKLAVVFRVLNVPIVSGLFAFVMAEMFILLAIPGMFADVSMRRSGFLSPLAVHAAWWAFGLVPVLYVMLVRGTDALDPVQRRIVRTFMALPFISLVAHLCLANWVYDVAFHPSNLAPLLLGLTPLVGRYDRHVATLASRMRLQLALPFTAVALAAIKFPPELMWDVNGVTLSPLRLALLGATVVYLDGWWLHRHPYFLWAAAVTLGACGIGASVKSMVDNTAITGRSLADLLKRLVPKTASQWGVVSVAASFVLLGIGAAFSWVRAMPPRGKMETS